MGGWLNSSASCVHPAKPKPVGAKNGFGEKTSCTHTAIRLVCRLKQKEGCTRTRLSMPTMSSDTELGTRVPASSSILYTGARWKSRAGRCAGNEREPPSVAAHCDWSTWFDRSGVPVFRAAASWVRYRGDLIEQGRLCRSRREWEGGTLKVRSLSVGQLCSGEVRLDFL